MSTQPYTGWAVCEQMGFKKTVCKVSEAEQYGAKMVRMEIPVFSADRTTIESYVTEFAGGPSLYNICPVSEEVGIDMARYQSDPRPVQPRAYRLEHKPETVEEPPPTPYGGRVPDDPPDFSEVDDEEPRF